MTCVSGAPGPSARLTEGSRHPRERGRLRLPDDVEEREPSLSVIARAVPWHSLCTSGRSYDEPTSTPEAALYGRLRA